MQQTKNERIEQFKMQGMDQVTAQKTADFESYWRNTEIGHRGLQPIEYDKDQGAMKY